MTPHWSEESAVTNPRDPRQIVVPVSFRLADDIHLPQELPGGFTLIDFVPDYRAVLDQKADNDRYFLGWNDAHALNDYRYLLVGGYSGDQPGVLDAGENRVEQRLLVLMHAIRVCARVQLGVSHYFFVHGNHPDWVFRSARRDQRMLYPEAYARNALGLVHLDRVRQVYERSCLVLSAAGRLPEGQQAPPLSFALRSHVMATRTPYPEVRFVALVGVLEALVGAEPGFASQDFRRRVPALFDPGDHEHAGLDLAAIYSVRSRLAHGRGPGVSGPDGMEIQTRLEVATDEVLAMCFSDDARFEALGSAGKSEEVETRRAQFFKRYASEELTPQDRARRMATKAKEAIVHWGRLIGGASEPALLSAGTDFEQRVKGVLGEQ